MIDPATAIMAASTAFNAIKKGCQIGRDLEGMAGDLGRWSKAIADFDFAAKRVENPKWYQAMGGSVEAMAMELFVQKKQKENMRDELRQWISGTLGPSAWQELIRMENEIRQKQKEQEYKRIERKEAIIAWSAGFFLFLLATGALFGFVWLLVNY
jgi:hypothetical protein